MIKSIEKPILLLVDGHSLAFRSFYAFSKGGEGGLSTKDGKPTSVTYGFLKSLLEHCRILNPKGITIAFDTAEPTFRHKADKNYKANRDIAPEKFFIDLAQLQKILSDQLHISLCMAPGFEADDVLGTLANKAVEEGWRVRILSGDRDLFQLVDDKRDIAVLYMGGGPYAKNSGPVLIKEAGVIEKLGVKPNKVIELKALTGDSSDNIPGVKGVGPKTAINLLKENDDLDGIYSTLNKLQEEGSNSSQGAIKGAIKTKLINDKDNAYLSRHLAKILIDIPISTKTISQLGEIDHLGLKNILEDLELYSLSRELPKFIATFSNKALKKKNADSNIEESNKLKINSQIHNPNQQISNKININIDPQLITSEESLDSLLMKLNSFNDIHNPVAIDTETSDLNPFKAELVGIGFCWGDGRKDIAYVPIGHKNLNDSILKKTNEKIQLSVDHVLNKLADWLKSLDHPKTLQNAKYDRLILLRHGVNLNGVVMDTLLADYLYDSNQKHSLQEISSREIDYKPLGFENLVGKNQTFADVSIKEASLYCGMDVYLTRKLFSILSNKLKKSSKKLIDLLIKVEQPLEPVLAEMESTGIRVDIPYLKELSKELEKKINNLEKEAYNTAGIEFNLSSPKQLGEILFEKLKLDRKKSRRTKTGWSTNASVLERLEKDHPIVPLVLEHRTLNKLRTTYIDSLPELVEKETGRVHTDFNQAATATGRLSSSNPNLQNIPIRTEFSRRIRKAFLPKENWKILSADYSQIELRILAHLSGEEVLQEAYRQGDDVHSLTARMLLDKKKITSEERRLGKTINFGVVYGMGPQRFARETGVSQLEAKEFLAKYKERYPKVFAFLELQERLALSQGYVETILGRRRKFQFDKNGLGRLLGKEPYEINLEIARRGGLEAQQLRAAANAPIQGSSADIIKIAMVRLHQTIKESSLPANLLLQVHDELVVEAAPNAMENIRDTVVKCMEEAIKLTVPLVVETGIGNNWMEAK